MARARRSPTHPEPAVAYFASVTFTRTLALRLLVRWSLAALCACGGSVIAVGGDGGSDASATDAPQEAAFGDAAVGTATAPDCPGCTFPAPGAAPCSNAPTVKVVYPPDGVLLPPNLGVLSVQWVPYGAPFVRYEVDFSQSAQQPATDWRIITACSSQTTNTRGAATAGCEITVDPTSWAQLVAANRGGSPVSITVRGTTGGACASASADTVHVSFAEQDVPGTYFYWKSHATPLGTGGQIWSKTFGDPATPDHAVAAAPLQGALCAGCHTIARDRSRMLAYAVDDTDADYGGLGGTYLDATPLPGSPPVFLAGASSVTATVDAGGGTGQPPGWTAIAPNAGAYVTSNGVPCTSTGALCGWSGNGYAAAVPENAFSLWNGQTGAFIGAVPVGAAGTRPTMPDWSADGASLVYVVPSASASWDNGVRSDDDHVFGGSLYTVAYAGSGSPGGATLLVPSRGENNYYPSYSPDKPSSFVLFDRAPLDTTVPTLTGCKGNPPQAVCPNDSYSNPAARLMLVSGTPSSTPVDLQNANGSSSALASRLSNSYPRWVPAVQSYKGRKLLWITFSSTRDYGLRITNQATDLYPCYPPDSLEWPGSTHHAVMSAQCQQPQLWMAPVLVDPATGTLSGDPSGAAFWIPYQDMTAHNHMASWSQ